MPDQTEHRADRAEVVETRLTDVVDKIRSAGSIEAALSVIPSTLDRGDDFRGDDRQRSRVAAQEARARWLPVVEAIRAAATTQDAIAVMKAKDRDGLAGLSEAEILARRNLNLLTPNPSGPELEQLAREEIIFQRIIALRSTRNDDQALELAWNFIANARMGRKAGLRQDEISEYRARAQKQRAEWTPLILAMRRAPDELAARQLLAGREDNFSPTTRDELAQVLRLRFGQLPRREDEKKEDLAA